MPIKSLIRTIPDYPKPGVQFRDITTLLQDPEGLRISVDGLIEPYLGERVDKVAGIEARGLILGGPVALKLGAGFIPVRKKGKLPWRTIGESYNLEYGTDHIEIHADAVAAGERVLLIDDLIATGGTAEAAIRVIERSGGTVLGLAVVIELPELGGRERIEAIGHKLVSLCRFEGE